MIAMLLVSTSFISGYDEPASKPKPIELDAKIKEAFGSVVDPKGDSKFVTDGKKLKVTIGPGDHSLHVKQNRMDAPRLLKEMTGDFTVEVRVNGEYPEEGTPAVKGRDFLFHSAGLLLMVDDKNYIRLEKARIMNRGADANTYVSFELFKEGEWARAGTANDGKLNEAKPVHLKLARKGTAVVGYFSDDDGQNWNELKELTIPEAKTLKVGIVANHNTKEESVA